MDNMQPKLLPLEYCSVERASRLLNCEIEDILHWVKMFSIKACVFIDPPRSSIRNVSVQLNIHDQQGLDSRSNTAQMIKHIRERDYSMIDTDYSQIGPGKRPLKKSGISINKLELQAEIYGFWEVLGNIDDYLNEDFAIKNPILRSYDPHNENSNFMTGFGALDCVTRKDILIMKPCLTKLYDAIYNDTILVNDFWEFTRNEASKYNKSERTTSTAKDVIQALVSTHPQLGKELLEKPSSGGEVLSNYLENKHNIKVSPRQAGRYLGAK